jgi:hypothetical protein
MPDADGEECHRGDGYACKIHKIANFVNFLQS